MFFFEDLIYLDQKSVVLDGGSPNARGQVLGKEWFVEQMQERVTGWFIWCSTCFVWGQSLVAAAYACQLKLSTSRATLSKEGHVMPFAYGPQSEKDEMFFFLKLGEPEIIHHLTKLFGDDLWGSHLFETPKSVMVSNSQGCTTHVLSEVATIDTDGYRYRWFIRCCRSLHSQTWSVRWVQIPTWLVNLWVGEWSIDEEIVW